MNSELQKQLNKRLRPLYFTAFFQGFVLWYAIEKLFMQGIGFDSQSIATATVIYISVTLIVNVPSGILADRWSRKGVIAIATIALIVGTLICGLSHSFWPYVLGISLWGIFYACYTGTYDSVIYDTLLEETGNSDSYESYYGKLQVYDSMALIAGSLLSGVIGKYFGLRADFFATIPLSACSLLFLYYFREPSLHKQAVPGKVIEIMKAVFQKGFIFWVVLGLVFAELGLRLMFEFSQIWLLALAVPVIFYGPAEAIVQFSTAFAGTIANRIKQSCGSIGITASLSVVAGFGLIYRHWAVIIASQTLLIITFMIMTIILNRRLHDTLPSNIRAGASSVVSTISYVAFIPAGLLFGAISKQQSVFVAAWLNVGVSMIAFIAVVVTVYKYNNSPITSVSSIKS